MPRGLGGPGAFPASLGWLVMVLLEDLMQQLGEAGVPLRVRFDVERYGDGIDRPWTVVLGPGPGLAGAERLAARGLDQVFRILSEVVRTLSGERDWILAAAV